MKWSGLALALLVGCVCRPGTVDCDGECLDVRYDRDNCGACGNQCAPGSVCSDQRCVTRGATGQSCSTDSNCDDGNECNGRERCVNHVCFGGEAVQCDDGVMCTRDVCEPGHGCVSTPDSSLCGAHERCTAKGTSGCSAH
jgi:hypothetical protein